ARWRHSRRPSRSGNTCAASGPTGRHGTSDARISNTISGSSATSIARRAPSTASPIVEALAGLERAFARLGVRWFLFGAQAAILYGVARLSADIDVTVDLGERSSEDLVRILAEGGFDLAVADVEGFIAATRVLPFVHRASRVPVDVVLAGPGLEKQ